MCINNSDLQSFDDEFKNLIFNVYLDSIKDLGKTHEICVKDYKAIIFIYDSKQIKNLLFNTTCKSITAYNAIYYNRRYFSTNCHTLKEEYSNDSTSDYYFCCRCASSKPCLVININKNNLNRICSAFDLNLK